MRVAAIDIGTNTILLLIADIDDAGRILPIAHFQRLPRLGKNVDKDRRISLQSFEEVGEVLQEYSRIISQHHCSSVAAVGTSALRDASNKEEFCAAMRERTGISIEVLPGNDEARWTYEGAISGFNSLSSSAAVLDIGGGSTELTYKIPAVNHHNNFKLVQHSLQLGAVRITERYFDGQPPSSIAVEQAQEFILGQLSQIDNSGLSDYQLIAVAGTATTLACLDQGLQDFDLEKVSGYQMKAGKIETWFDRLSSKTTNEIRSLSNATEGRADILTAGVLILNTVMRYFGFSSATVSERGLRYGLVLREWRRSMGQDK